MAAPHIMILGIGNKLLCDEGFGIHVIEALEDRYAFGPNISLVDGGVLGMNLLGVLSEADHLIVVDVIRNHGKPGTLYRIDHEDIPNRMRAKNSIHQIDFLEALTCCRVGLDIEPRAVIFGVEPLDIETFTLDMTPEIRSRVDDVVSQVLRELTALGGVYSGKGDPPHVSGHTLQNHRN